MVVVMAAVRSVIAVAVFGVVVIFTMLSVFMLFFGVHVE